MRLYCARTVGRTLTVVLVAAVALTVAGFPGRAQDTSAVGMEFQREGLTVAERIARQQALHAEIAPLVPDGVDRDPLRVEIGPRDREMLGQPFSNDGTAPLRIGVVKPVPGTVGKSYGGVFNRGIVQSRVDGSFVWAMSVSSPGAQAIRVHLTDVDLPEGAELYFLGPDGQAFGPYTGKGRNGDGDFWTRSIKAEAGQLVLRYRGTAPKLEMPEMSLRVSDIAHINGRRTPQVQERSHDSWPCSDNAPCVVDAMCVNGTPAEAAKDAIAKMEWISGQFVNTCSGGLLTDTDSGSQIPHFLTANHCFSQSISNLETFFNYATDSCNGSCPDGLTTGGTPPPASTVGFTVLASGSDGDFTLGTLDEAPPAGAVFLPWDNTPIATTNGASLHRISNANFGPQVYSQHDVDTGSPECSGLPRGEAIYSVDITGATMGGSSGSPVLNASGEVVGQLTGCCGFNCANECDAANNWTIDGALAFYWDSVKDFLDPQAGCASDAECDDGQFCTGAETCVAGSCQSSGDPCAGGESCNETTDTCDVSSCGDGTCGAGEDCNNCPADCRSKVNGNPNSRYCCDGDLPDCGDSRCSESPWSCGGGGGNCSVDADCDDGAFCNGAEICSGGSCQSGSDPCPGQGCDESGDVCVTCAGNKETCSSNSDCCSNKCRGGTCKGN